ncbi:MAG: heparinase II/III family protein [Candidatus Hydrogenedentota bacterium]
MFMHVRCSLTVLLLLGGILVTGNASGQEMQKTESTLYGPDIVAAVRRNVDRFAWAGAARDSLREHARPWLEMSEDELWDLMFGATIPRSWMVWSNGYCPACETSVPMYNWKMDALNRPWKVQCPHCGEVFPKNDFGAFYASGLDEHGVFDPGKADRSLLFNVEHPDPDDPLHMFGVDDGTGYVEGGKRWRFIGAYLVYGQWKQAIVDGIRTLAALHLMTGDQECARKAAILIDRVADLYPTFDFGEQGFVYERKADRGYVSTWHDACEETREIIMAYDMIFEAIKDDPKLVAFLSKKSREYTLENPKASFADIQRNIETRILRDAIVNRQKIRTNYPRTEIALAITHAVLGMPENEDAFWEIVDPMLEKATSVDGVTGEKGLAGYSRFTISALGLFLGEFMKSAPGFLSDVLERHPDLRDTFRFFADTMCLGRYYPQIGDTGAYCHATDEYVGLNFVRYENGSGSSGWSSVPPSMFTLCWQYYKETNEPWYLQIAYRENGNAATNLPYDFFIDDPGPIVADIEAVIDEHGPELALGSVDKKEWHLALMRSGEGEARRVLWLDYDAGGGHGHADAMNLGLFAKGLDLLPEFGYPPVQFGGWGSPRARWYTMSAAHNTVVVDGANSIRNQAGETSLWAEGASFHAMRMSGANLVGGERFERTAIMVDVSPEDFYVLDVFHVRGGHDHAKFLHSHFGEVAVSGLNLERAEDYGHETQMRNFRMDPAAQPGWSADWDVEDKLKLLEEPRDIHLRYTDFTKGTSAGLAEGWIALRGFKSSEESWIPRVVVRRQNASDTSPLESTFVGVLEPYEGSRFIKGIRRLPVQTLEGQPLGDAHAAVEIDLADGRRDILIVRDRLDGSATRVAASANTETRTDGEIALVRLNADGEVVYTAICAGSMLESGEYLMNLEGIAEFHEIDNR